MGLVLFIGLIPDDASAASGSTRISDVKRDPSVPGRDFSKKRPATRDEATGAFKPAAGTVPARTFTTLVTDRRDKLPKRAPLTAGAEPGTTPGATPVQTGPVKVRQPAAQAAKAARAAAADPGSAVQVQVKDATAARKAGVQGLLFTAAPAKNGLGPAASGTVELELDYASFKDTYGGDWGSRLRLYRLPACALTTPELEPCRTRSALPGANDASAHTVSGSADLAAASAAPAVFAAAAEASGPGGSHAATSLSPSGSWIAGSSSGGFSWSYPIEAPEVPGGPQPEVELSYSSQAVDGRTASTNAQSSWIAEGWDYEPGYIERRFRSCSDDKDPIKDDKGVEQKPNNSGDSGDLCWGSDHVVMSLGGNTTELVKKDGTDDWRPADDDGSRLQRKTGAANGAKDGEHWVLTTTDGTQYHFGLNKLPNAPDGTVTNSALTVPVFGNHPGEPCHATAFIDSDCAQAYRWNLDYVVDPLGDAMTLWWTKETNFYGQNMKADQQISYTRSAQLARIDYGLRSDKLFGVHPAGRVAFTTAERCIPTATFDCAEAKRTAANAKNWPDAPLDQECASGAKCTDKYSPTFWTTKRLTKITTSVLSGSALKTVDSWALEQSYPATGDGTSPALWLDAIARTGHGAGATAAMPKVTFAGIQLDNRVDKVEGLPPFSRYRVHAIDTETGGRIGVTYSARDCQALEPKRMPASPESNTMRCFPQYWTPKGALNPVKDWFHKYVVTEVREEDLVTDSPAKVTSYEFLGGTGWAYDDSEFTENKHRTWSQYRGYERVRTRQGGGGDVKQLTEHRYFRGLHGDKLPSGTRSSDVTDSEGKAYADLPQYQGQLLEQIAYESDGGSVDSATVTTPWAVRTATRTRAGTTPLEAWMTRPESVRTRERVKGDTWRTSTETTKYDSYGLPYEVEEKTPGGRVRCSTVGYARNTTAYLIESESREKTVLGACGTTGGEVVEDTRTFYDNLAFGAAPTKGLPTEVQELNGKGDGYVTIDRTEYDVHGRETATWDADNRKTWVEYTPATVARPTKQVSTDPLLHTETTVFDDVRGLPLTETDANGKTATMQYDPLGRLLKVWEIDRDPATQTPTATYDYAVRRDGPTITTARTLKDDGEYAVSYEILDGLMRERQTQDEAVGTGRIVNDTFYDSAGRKWKENEGYYNTAEPEAKLLQVGDNEVPSQNRTLFDGLGQPTADITYYHGTEKLRTTTERDGDVSTTIPPGGDTVTAVFEDAEGRVEKLREYTDSARTKWRDTLYQYDALDNLEKVTAPGGATTSFEYDKRGRQTAVVDPDGGRTEMRYDNADNVIATVDPFQRTLVTTYDGGGRPTTLREGSDTGPKRLEWTYDSLGKGLPTAQIRYEGGREYREEITAYDNAYRVKSSKTVIPTEETGLAGSYEYSYSYTPTGNLAWVEVPGLGGLTTERIVFRYNSDGLPISIAGASAYLAGVDYSAFGEVLRTDAGPAGKKVYGSYVYDEFTRRLQSATFDRSLAPGRISETRFGYDQAGNVTRITDVPGSASPDAGKTDTQCFVYDKLRQMTSAWTAKTEECAATPTKETVGGPEAYWQSYQYDEAGNRKTLVEHDTTGDPAKDVTRSYLYGKAGVGGPNALAEIKSVGPQGERLSTFAYDKAGNTVGRQNGGTDQTLEYDVEGQLRKVTEPVEGGGAKTTSYLYGANGERLIRTGADGSRTLYLAEAELTVNAANDSAKAERFYPHPDGSTTVRATGGARQLMLADHHGTSHTVVDMIDPAMGVTRRKSMPFGEARGQQPAAWPGQRGFVGGTVDKDTGLTRLGARDYDPATGRFLQVDPMVDYGQPATMNPYAYSNNAPATFSDPSGEFFPVVVLAGIAARIAIQAAIRAAARRAAIIAARKAAQAAARRAAALARKRALEAAKRAAAKAKREAARKAAAAKRAAAKKAAARAAAKRAAARKAAAQARARAARAAAKKAAARRAAARKAAARPKPRAKPRSQPKPRPKPSQVKRAVKKVAKEVREEVKETVKEEVQAQACEVNSFVPGTKVLMADGSAKPIEQVKAGDKVVATDPRTGKTTVQTATATIIGKGSKDLVRITLTVHDGSSAQAKPTTVTATAGHPFWVPTLREWIDAGELKPGQWLQTSSGAWIRIGAVEAWTAERATVHNLTVTDVHTYYVLVGAAPILVHNCNPAFTDDPYNKAKVDERIHPQEVHDTVDAIATGAIGQRQTGPVGSREWDVYQRRSGRNGTPRKALRWVGATVYTGVGDPRANTRVLVRPDGEIGYILGHNYNQVFSYPWRSLPQAYTGRSGPVRGGS
ncbi:polymorphic toxin-type HINT domain-containing protein [Streptomyces sp. ME18-1-4]|uniref:polymorphic toxin-type HINT domain-containing protein n=1 Tax=Streptomyces sp. ME18-1-4 TaxID=3028685 RepID=UPI0029B1E75C|nr:polymorphic toxin-type HINT domain-containing protein [Streptomyces sp. ME18-1-4]MDX3244808.1 polymorphic toxin-type HINT domain-containing protein [Streptomyces sp. ME18-1-4]